MKIQISFEFRKNYIWKYRPVLNFKKSNMKIQIGFVLKKLDLKIQISFEFRKN